MKTGKYFHCQTCNTEFYRAPWQIARGGEIKQKFCSLTCRRHEKNARIKMSLKKMGKDPWNKGLSKITDSRLDFFRPTLFKDEGKAASNMLIRKSTEMRFWRTSVFKRDNFTCQLCGQHGGKLHADHIKPFCTFPELRFDLANGRTLCISCHKNTDTFGRKALNFKPDDGTNYYGTISQNF